MAILNYRVTKSDETQEKDKQKHLRADKQSVVLKAMSTKVPQNEPTMQGQPQGPNKSPTGWSQVI